MISVKDLLMSYDKKDIKVFTGGKKINILYWTDDESSEDEYINKKSNNKLDFNISKYIKKNGKTR
jgi:hypothetical protein